HGAVVVQYGDTVTLVTAVEGEAEEERDFFPLVVDYREKVYAAGKFPGGFIKREGRPTTKEILTSRLIDRPIRPLFPSGYRRDVRRKHGVGDLVCASADRQSRRSDRGAAQQGRAGREGAATACRGQSADRHLPAAFRRRVPRVEADRGQARPRRQDS